MPKKHRHLANKCEDIINLQDAEAYCVATRTACYDYYYEILFATLSKQNGHFRFADRATRGFC